LTTIVSNTLRECPLVEREPPEHDASLAVGAFLLGKRLLERSVRRQRLLAALAFALMEVLVYVHEADILIS
jgi:hypothetical protein